MVLFPQTVLKLSMILMLNLFQIQVKSFITVRSSFFAEIIYILSKVKRSSKGIATLYDEQVAEKSLAFVV